MGSININGKTYTGNNIQVKNDVVYIDGKRVGDEDGGVKTKNGILKIEVTGDLMNLEADGSVTCENVGDTVQAGGSVTCENVGDTVQAGGSVTCENVGGTVQAGGSVNTGGGFKHGY